MKHLLLLIIYVLPVCGLKANDTVRAVNGVMDLTSRNWTRDGTVDLNGNWEFYWNKFYTPSSLQDSAAHKPTYIFVPSFWNDYIPDYQNFHPGFGYATYRLKILCPHTNDALALKFLTVASAYRLFVNGKEVLTVGVPGNSAAATVHNLRPSIVNVVPENYELEIIIQVSNFNNRVGGIWDFVKLGTRDQVESIFIRNMALQFFIAGSFFLMGIYYLILFLFFRKRYVLFFFSMLCFIIVARSLATNEIPLNYIADWSWETVRRIEYISFYLSVPLMAFFSHQLFPHDFSRKVLYAILAISFVFIILAVFEPAYIYTFVLRDYQTLMIVAALYGMFVYIKAAWKKRPGSAIFLAGFCIFFITIINDILYADLIINTTTLFYVGLFVFVISLSILLARQFASTLTAFQLGNLELSIINKELHIKNNDIEEKNQQLTKLNHELDSLVYRTSHDLRSPIASVLGIVQAARDESNIKNIGQYFDMQEKTLERMDFFIQDIIDFSKNKRLELDLQEIDFKTIVQQSVEDHEYAGNGVHIHKQTEIIQDEKFVSDPRRVKMIINNLLSNAIKYSDASKDHQMMHTKVIVANNKAMIEVKDNGLGIAEAYIDKIFTMFYRATSSSSGSGLGLYILKETVEKLNGTVTIQSKLKEGTTVVVTIPDMQNTL